jgi:hypothetical protein
MEAPAPAVPQRGGHWGLRVLCSERKQAASKVPENPIEIGSAIEQRGVGVCTLATPLPPENVGYRRIEPRHEQHKTWLGPSFEALTHNLA